MSALEDNYLTVREAASLLRVAPSTVRRWIREGDVPAFRLGKRRVALRRADLSALITPLHAERHEHGNDDASQDVPVGSTPEEGERHEAEGMARVGRIRQEGANRPLPEVRQLTDDEVDRALKVLDDLKNMREEDRARRGGKPFPPSWIAINEMRDERTRQLMGE